LAEYRVVLSRELQQAWVLIRAIDLHDGLNSRQMKSLPLLQVAWFCFSMSTLWPLVVVESVAATQIDRVYVVVNEEVVTQSEVDRELRNAVYDLRSRGEVVPPLSELQQRVVEQIVVQRIQYQRTQQLQMSLDEEQLIDAIQVIAKRNNISMLQLREEVQKSGRSFDEYRQELGRQVLVQKLIEKKITRHIRISEAEIDKYLELQPRSDGRLEYRLSHVLIESGTNPEDAQAVAKNARARILSGTPFEVIAAELSGSALAGNSSDLGWRNSEQLPDLFLEIVGTMTVGEVTRPIQSQNGFHILRLNAQRGGGSYVVDQIRARQILLVVNEISDESETRQRLLQIRARISAGEDFADIARLHSADLRSRALGGDLGWLNPGDLAPELERVATAMPLGELSVPIQTQLGHHLIQITDRRRQDIGEQVQRHEARREIRKEKFNQRYEEWVKELREKAWVDYRLGIEN
jgi:peptidyl-prolyl cis-trans isomerase SurA